MEKDIILKAENISKQYRLGQVGTGTLSHDLNRWWHQIRGKENPYLKIGDINDRSTKGTSDYVWALQDINFEVERGEVLGIIGKNGAGKSTLLKILSKVTAPTTGSIKSRGRIASLLEVGTGFHGEMTGRENVFLNGAILGMTKKEIASKLDEIIEFSGCERYIDTPVKRYSSGMTVRLAFAVAAFLEPEILIVDEVLAVGDAEFQKKAIGKMKDISKGEGRTVLFVSHSMGAIRALTTKCILMSNGSIVSIGTTDRIVDEYIKIGIQTGKENTYDKIPKKKSGLQIRNVSFLDNGNIENSTILSGQFVKIKIEIENFSEIEYKNCFIGVGIFTLTENMLTALKSDITDVYYDIKPGLNFVYCLIEKFPLSPGDYKYNINIRDFANIYDSITDAGYLSVEPGSFFKSGKLPASSFQTILIEQNWK